MKDFFKTLFTMFIVASAFLVGYYLGEEKVRSEIPDFQEEKES
ncbi:MAG: hypothetical protein ACE5LC_03405 [Candidatus Aminicenantales bacterium]